MTLYITTHQITSKYGTFFWSVSDGVRNETFNLALNELVSLMGAVKVSCKRKASHLNNRRHLT